MPILADHTRKVLKAFRWFLSSGSIWPTARADACEMDLSTEESKNWSNFKPLRPLNIIAGMNLRRIAASLRFFALRSSTVFRSAVVTRHPGVLSGMLSCSPVATY
jgi:hypothetical protein